MHSRSPSLLPSPGRGGSAGGLEEDVNGQWFGEWAIPLPKGD